MRLLVGVVLAVILSIAAPVAEAAQRYAAPGGSGEFCSESAPCDLAQAIKGAESGNEVIVRAGTYEVGTSLGPKSPNVFVHGDFSGPMPTVIGTKSGAVPILVPAMGGRLSYLEVVNRSEPNPVAVACNPGGTIERVRAVAESSGKALGLLLISKCAATD